MLCLCSCIHGRNPSFERPYISQWKVNKNVSYHISIYFKTTFKHSSIWAWYRTVQFFRSCPGFSAHWRNFSCGYKDLTGDWTTLAVTLRRWLGQRDYLSNISWKKRNVEQDTNPHQQPTHEEVIFYPCKGELEQGRNRPYQSTELCLPVLACPIQENWFHTFVGFFPPSNSPWSNLIIKARLLFRLRRREAKWPELTAASSSLVSKSSNQGL